MRGKVSARFESFLVTACFFVEFCVSRATFPQKVLLSVAFEDWNVALLSQTSWQSCEAVTVYFLLSILFLPESPMHS
jgi:hypothetical protein